MGAPFSRPAGHRQSVREQEPRAEPAQARPSARRRPGVGLGAAGGEAAGRTRAATATATAGAGGSGPEQGKESGGECSQRNAGRILAWRARPPLPLAAAPHAEWGRRPERRTQDPLLWPQELLEFGLLQLLALWGLDLFLALYPSLFAALNPKLQSALRSRAPSDRRWAAARRSVSNMRRLGTCLATLAGLLLTAAGETFSGKWGHFCRRLGRAALSGSPGRR